MVLTRQGSRLLANIQNSYTMANTQTTTTLTSNTITTWANQVVCSTSAVPTTGITTTNVLSSIAPPVPDDVSFSSEGFNNTIISPDFGSITAQNIRREFREDNLNTEGSFSGGNTNNLEEVVASIGLVQAQMMRSLEEIRQMRQETTRAQAENNATQHLPTTNAYLPPPPIPTEIPQTMNEPIPIVPPPPFFGPAEMSQPLPQISRQAVNTEPEPQMRPHPIMNVFPHHQPLPPFYGYPSPQTSPPKLNLKKWGIKFDGSNKTIDADDFIFRVEALRQDYGYSFNELTKDFQQLLEGDAHDWYWTNRRLTPFRSWPELREAFLAQFRRFENEFQIQKKIMDRRQMPQESFEDFFNAVVKLRNQQRSPYSEEDLVEIMKGNLKSSLASLIFPIKIYGLNHFRQEVKRAESMLANQRQAYQQRSFQPPRVHEIEYENEASGTDFELDAINASSRYTCWNCRQLGHSYVECPTPIGRVFCFKCGREGVVTPKCPKCQGNLQRNRSQSGETRSVQTQTQ